MNFEQIEKLIKLLDETSIHEFKYETETLNLRICKEKKTCTSCYITPVTIGETVTFNTIGVFVC